MTIAGPGRVGPAGLRRGAVALLAAALAAQLAHGAWLALSPRDPVAGPSGTASAAPSPAAVPKPGFDPFAPRAASQAGVPDGGAVTGYRLFGVRQAGGEATAIIAGPDGVQRSVAVGEPVDESGTVLAATGGDHVVLRSGGRLHRLTFNDAPSTAAPGPSSPAPETASAPPPSASAGLPTQGAAPGPDLSPALNSALRPHRREGRIQGYAWRPGVDLAPLASAGLRPGDIITTINGMDFDNPERVQELADEAALGRSVTVDYVRDGRTHTATLRTAR